MKQSVLLYYKKKLLIHESNIDQSHCLFYMKMRTYKSAGWSHLDKPFVPICHLESPQKHFSVH